MSLASLLLAFAPAIAARFNPVPELEAENKRLKGELVDVKAELERLHVVCERLEREWRAERERAGLWRNHALRQRRNGPMPMGAQHAYQAWQQQQMAQQASQQQQLAMAQSAQNAQLQAYGQLSGLQQANWPEDWHCDCSPSRSAALGLLVPGA